MERDRIAPGPDRAAELAPTDTRGLAYGLAAYGMWGTFPLFFRLLDAANPWEVLVHRVVWSLACCLLILAVLRQRMPWGVYRKPRTLALATCAALLIAANWTLYVYGVHTERVVETSLGYFINPLVSIALGVIVLGERLRRLQWVAVAMGSVAVLVLSTQTGRFPWIAIGLALLFATYGLCKNAIGRSVGALPSLTIETLILLPLMLPLFAMLWTRDATVFGAGAPGTSAMLIFVGALTALPLLAFGAAARRLPLSMMGLLQYVAPTLQFIIGVAWFNEPMSAARWAGFVLVWIALVALTIDQWRNSRGNHTNAR